MLLVPVIICSEIPGRTTNSVTAVHLHYNRRGLWLPEENLNNSGLSDALAVLVHTKTSKELGNSVFKITYCPWDFCSCLCRITRYWLMKKKNKKEKRKMTDTVPIRGSYCQFCHSLISSMTKISTWPQLNYHTMCLGRLSSNKQHSGKHQVRLVLPVLWSTERWHLYNQYMFFAESIDGESCKGHFLDVTCRGRRVYACYFPWPVTYS